MKTDEQELKNLIELQRILLSISSKLNVLDNEFNAIEWKRVNNTTDSYRCIISKKKLDKINSIINDLSGKKNRTMLDMASKLD
jgi:hypothetical protein